MRGMLDVALTGDSVPAWRRQILDLNGQRPATWPDPHVASPRTAGKSVLTSPSDTASAGSAVENVMVARARIRWFDLDVIVGGCGELFVAKGLLNVDQSAGIVVENELPAQGAI